MNPTTFQSGLVNDSLPKYQPPSSYRFALNAVLETQDGTQPALSYAGGNIATNSALPAGKKIIGSVLTNTDETVLFLYDTSGQHEIGKFNPNTKTYTTILLAECLNFSDKYPVNGIFKMHMGCDPYVYFTDNYNPYRVINLNDTEQYKIGGVYYCPKLDFSRDYFRPCVVLTGGQSGTGILENAGGQLQVGVYYFAVRFLDKYQNATKWTVLTRPIAIGNESYSYTQDVSTVSSYDGGSNSTDSDFYVPPTGKAISLQINGGGELFDYYQLAVVKRTSDAGAITGVDLLQAQPWTSTTATFIYKGTTEQIAGTTSLDDLLSDVEKINKVAAHALHNDVLFLGGTTNSYKDYSTYQRYASKIKTEFVKTFISDPKNSRVRQGVYYFREGSFMEDEVYPFGIVYVFGSGEESPVFPTVGRAANTDIPVDGANPYIGTGGVATDTLPWDTGVASYGSGPSNNQRWARISTAVQYGTNMTGLMGYHESDTQTYPDIPTCDNHPDGYWGRDWHGNLIVPGTTKIRHHRMPGAEIRDAAAAHSSYRTGVRFSNVEYPPDQDIVAHYFVYGDREFERKILAKGAFIPLEIIGDEHTIDPSTIAAKTYNPTPPPNFGINAYTFAFISSDLLLNEKTFKGSYVKFEKIYRDLNQESDDASITANSVASNFVFDEEKQYEGTLDLTTQNREFTKYTLPTSSALLHTMRTELLLPKSYQGAREGSEKYEPLSGTTFTNNSINNNYHIIRLNSGSTDINAASGAWRGKLIFGAIYQNRDVFSNLYNIKYKRMANCVSYEGDATTTYTFYGGDTAVSKLSMVDFNYQQTGIPTENDASSISLDVDAYHLSFFTQDTLLNYEMRHGASTDKRRQYYQPKYPTVFSKNHEIFRKYLRRKIYAVADKAYGLYPEEYHYNASFSFLDGLQHFYPVQYNYSYCNTCIEDAPYRIWYSLENDLESQEDKLRIIKPLNYSDAIGGSSGAITDMFVNFDKLYITTPRSIFYQPTKPQVLKTDSAEIYLGNGEVLSQKPIELKNSSTAFGGQEHFSSRLSTEYGTLYIDSLGHAPILLTSQINDLAKDRLKAFWREHARLNFLEQFYDLTASNYGFISHTSPIGVGFKTFYDPIYKTAYIHKKDYRLLPQWTSKLIYYPTETDLIGAYTTPDQIWYNGHSMYYNDPNGNQFSVVFDNAQFFENLSFTISIRLDKSLWQSYHSFLPTFGFADSTGFYTQTGDSDIFKHIDSNYGVYYNDKYPFVVDTILDATPSNPSLYSSIDMSAYTSTPDAATEELKQTGNFFNEVIFYNSQQSTGKRQLVKAGPLAPGSTQLTYTRLTDKKWKVNQIRDWTISKDQPIWDKSWASKASSPYNYIDKVVNTNNINANKSAFETPRMRDYYLGGRFFFLPQGEERITVDLMRSSYNQNNR